MKRFIFTLLPLLLLVSCEPEPALFLHEHSRTGPVRIAVDWAKFVHKETPTGMTIMLFEQTDSGCYLVSSNISNNIQYSDYQLLPSIYAAYVFNQSRDEFGTATFSNLDDWDNAKVTTNQAASGWYKDTITTDPLVRDVEWIGTESHDNITLTKAMLDEASGERITIDTLHPHNIVSTITVYVHIKNISSLRSARSSLNGLAKGYYIGLGHTMPDKVTQLLENWHMSVDSTTESGRMDGTIVDQISSFGLPYGHTAQPEENTLHLDCLLKNDSILSYDYLVGNRFVFDTDDNADLHFYIDIYIDEPLPDIPQEDSNSGFAVTVEDWGDEHPVVISD